MNYFSLSIILNSLYKVVSSKVCVALSVWKFSVYESIIDVLLIKFLIKWPVALSSFAIIPHKLPLSMKKKHTIYWISCCYLRSSTHIQLRKLFFFSLPFSLYLSLALVLIVCVILLKLCNMCLFNWVWTTFCCVCMCVLLSLYPYEIVSNLMAT